jgi:hypothetical protein
MKIVSPHTAGDPMNSKKWLNCRLKDVKKELEEQGHGVSVPVISRLLKQHDYSLQANAKQVEGKQHPDRNQQFEYIQEQRDKFQETGQPEISVDTKKRS